MKAIVIGATGLVGKNITEQLLENSSVSEVHVYVRRNMSIEHERLKIHVVDFDKDDWLENLKGDVLFSALGTTIKAAGSQDNQFRVDHDYQLKVAKAAARNGVTSYVLISSINANAASRFFYLRMKGELEEKIRKLPFHSVSILRPGPLKGYREHKRLGEKISVSLLERLPSFLVSKSMKPIHGKDVARVAVTAGLLGQEGLRIINPA